VGENTGSNRGSGRRKPERMEPQTDPFASVRTGLPDQKRAAIVRADHQSEVHSWTRIRSFSDSEFNGEELQSSTRGSNQRQQKDSGSLHGAAISRKVSMRQQDYYRYQNNSFRSYVGRLIKVTVISLLLGAIAAIICLIVGYNRLKPLQSIYLWQYLTSARRSSRSETGVSDYRLLVRMVPDPDGKIEATNPPKVKLKGKRDPKNKTGLEAQTIRYLLCNDDQVDAVYVNGEQSRTSEGDRKFRLKKPRTNNWRGRHSQSTTSRCGHSSGSGFTASKVWES